MLVRLCSLGLSLALVLATVGCSACHHGSACSTPAVASSVPLPPPPGPPPCGCAGAPGVPPPPVAVPAPTPAYSLPIAPVPAYNGIH